MITLRQRAWLLAIRDYSQTRGYPPTVRDLLEILGVASLNSASTMLARLQRKGLVKWEPGEVRTLLLTQAGEEAISR